MLDFLTKAGIGGEKFKYGSVIIRDRIIAIGSCVHQISNISTLAIIPKTLPNIVYFLVIVGFLLFITPMFRDVGIFCLFLTAIITYAHYQSKDLFSLKIVMNSGSIFSLASNSVKPLHEVMRAIYQDIQEKTPTNMEFVFGKTEVTVNDHSRHTNNVIHGDANGPVVGSVDWRSDIINDIRSMSS
jgi:hypothetical protein